ncbi:hypothetical protein PIIN_10216 [Serendipita indica DSM 11827]|uniref:Uncharacterized protein n=1 Tax=Serendipita indica (strain DSM 11827) TaxID=1109443 RepID=G4TY30_SERID|nr:hypothetical protein PIIN_10216 [Serendipita indica DSM 11827]
MDIIVTTFSSLSLGTILLLCAIPWWPVIKIAITLSFIVFPVMLFLRHLRNHPLSEGSTAYLWSGLWILSYTRPTTRIHKYLQSNGVVRYRLSRLPTEIWYKILTFALDMPEIMDSICTSEIIWEEPDPDAHQTTNRASIPIHRRTESSARDTHATKARVEPSLLGVEQHSAALSDRVVLRPSGRLPHGQAARTDIGRHSYATKLWRVLNELDEGSRPSSLAYPCHL